MSWPDRRAHATARWLCAAAAMVVVGGCAGGSGGGSAASDAASTQVSNPDELLIVDCLLPGRLQQLGSGASYVTPRMPARVPAVECRIRGGEYTAYDRADLSTALKVWLPKAKEGDSTAQNYVGEIYEKGLGVEADYDAAAHWYRQAAEAGDSSAMINLGQLFDRGLGVPKDPVEARRWYRKASGLDSGTASFVADAAGAAPATAIAAVELPAPEIEIVEPPVTALTRSIRVSWPDPVPVRAVVGRVQAAAGLATLTVDAKPVTPDANGLFRTEIAASEKARTIEVVAEDKRGKQSRRSFEIPARSELATAAATRGSTAPTPSGEKGVDYGRYRALVIGNDAYQFLPRLRTARADAQAVSQTLESRYGFEVTTLLDATRYDLLSALNRLRSELTEKDNLLIYYAGHGELDEVNDRGNWLPVDAEPESSANWISNTAITDILNAMSARHVLVVSDSCYSGSLTRSSLAKLDAGVSSEAKEVWRRAMASKRSRTALTSGGLAPVLDSGGGEHSVFARYFLEVIEANDEVMEGQRLYRELSARVTYAAENRQFEQLPQYAPIRFAGHEAGEFFFVPRLGG